MHYIPWDFIGVNICSASPPPWMSLLCLHVQRKGVSGGKCHVGEAGMVIRKLELPLKGVAEWSGCCSSVTILKRHSQIPMPVILSFNIGVAMECLFFFHCLFSLFSLHTALSNTCKGENIKQFILSLQLILQITPLNETLYFCLKCFLRELIQNMDTQF